jgi:hypothetical protein
MEHSLSEDDLVLRLDDAARKRLDGDPVDSTLAGVLAELDSLAQDLRQPSSAKSFDGSTWTPSSRRTIYSGKTDVSQSPALPTP